MFLFLWGTGALACAGLVAGADPSPAQGVSEQQMRCMQLQQDLAAAQGGGGANRADLANVDKQIAQADRVFQGTQAAMEDAGCFDSFFMFGRGLVRSPKCINMNARVEDARRQLTQLQQQRQVLMGGGGNRRQRQIELGVGGVLALVAIYLSRKQLWAAEFPENDLGRDLADQVNRFSTWVVDTFGGVTDAIRDLITRGLLNPLQELLAESPWYVAALGILGLAYVFGRTKALVSTVVCLVGILLLDLWHDAMVTLTMTLVAAEVPQRTSAENAKLPFTARSTLEVRTESRGTALAKTAS